MESTRAKHTATLMNNGTVLVAGGQVPASNPNARVSATAELFDPKTGIFTSTVGNMTKPRAYQTATLLKGEVVLEAGGYYVAADNPFDHQHGSNIYLSAAELFAATSGMFAPTKDSMGFARSNHTATLLSDGTVLLIGGFDGNNGLATAELFEPVSGTITRTADMATPRAYHTATLLKDGTVLVTGGANGSGAPLAAAELYQ